MFPFHQSRRKKYHQDIVVTKKAEILGLLKTHFQLGHFLFLTVPNSNLKKYQKS